MICIFFWFSVDDFFSWFSSFCCYLILLVCGSLRYFEEWIGTCERISVEMIWGHNTDTLPSACCSSAHAVPPAFFLVQEGVVQTQYFSATEIKSKSGVRVSHVKRRCQEGGIFTHGLWRGEGLKHACLWCFWSRSLLHRRPGHATSWGSFARAWNPCRGRTLMAQLCGMKQPHLILKCRLLHLIYYTSSNMFSSGKVPWIHEQECEFWQDRGWLPLHQVTALQSTWCLWAAAIPSAMWG